MFHIQTQNTPTFENLKIEGKNAMVLVLNMNNLYWSQVTGKCVFIYTEHNKDFSSVWRTSDVVQYLAEDILER